MKISFIFEYEHSELYARKNLPEDYTIKDVHEWNGNSRGLTIINSGFFWCKGLSNGLDSKSRFRVYIDCDEFFKNLNRLTPNIIDVISSAIKIVRDKRIKEVGMKVSILYRYLSHEEVNNRTLVQSQVPTAPGMGTGLDSRIFVIDANEWNGVVDKKTMVETSRGIWVPNKDKIKDYFKAYIDYELDPYSSWKNSKSMVTEIIRDKKIKYLLDEDTYNE